MSSYDNADVNTAQQVIQLTNASGGFTAPYETAGTATTSTIVPASIAQWCEITFSTNIPAGTSITVHVTDGQGELFSDQLLPGNSTGFSTSPINISALSPLVLAASEVTSNAKVGQIGLLITLTTSNTSVTPTFSNLEVTWLPTQGNLAASPVATTDWPTPFINQQNTLEKDINQATKYEAFRWASPQSTGYPASNPMLVYNGQLISSDWFGADNTDYLTSYDTKTGNVDWQLPFDGRGYFTIAQDGIGYQSDMTNDVTTAIDMNKGSVNWTHAWYSGHGNDSMAIDASGNIYTVRNQGMGTTLTIYAFSPSGSVEWSRDVTVPDGTRVLPTAFALTSNGMLYFGAYDMNASESGYTNNGELFAFNLNTKSLAWSYPTGDLNWYPSEVIGPDGTIYTANYSDPGFTKYIYAFNPDGTLKWKEDYGADGQVGDDNDIGYTSLALTSNGTLLAVRNGTIDNNYSMTTVLQAINAQTGAFLWSKDDSLSNTVSFTDNNSIYDSSIISAGPSDDWYATTGYYDQNYNPYWQAVLPFSDLDGTNYVYYGFQTIGDDNGWMYGNLSKSEEDDNWNTLYQDDFTQYFAMAPWTLTSSVSGSLSPGLPATFTVTSSMLQSNPLLGGDNQVQIIMDNGKVLPLSYQSTDSSGNSVWSGSYVLPLNTTDASHSYTVEAEQAYVQTNQSTHFAVSATEANNTGLTSTGSYTVKASAIPILLPGQTGNGVSEQNSLAAATTSSAVTPTTSNVYNQKVQTATTNNKAPAQSKKSSFRTTDIVVAATVIVLALLLIVYWRFANNS